MDVMCADVSQESRTCNDVRRSGQHHEPLHERTTSSKLSQSPAHRLLRLINMKSERERASLFPTDCTNRTEKTNSLGGGPSRSAGTKASLRISPGVFDYVYSGSGSTSLLKICCRVCPAQAEQENEASTWWVSYPKTKLGCSSTHRPPPVINKFSTCHIFSGCCSCTVSMPLRQKRSFGD